PPPRAAPRTAAARALPLGPAGGRPGGVPGRARDPRRARPRALGRAPWARAADPPARPGPRPRGAGDGRAHPPEHPAAGNDAADRARARGRSGAGAPRTPGDASRDAHGARRDGQDTSRDGGCRRQRAGRLRRSLPRLRPGARPRHRRARDRLPRGPPRKRPRDAGRGARGREHAARAGQLRAGARRSLRRGAHRRRRTLAAGDRHEPRAAPHRCRARLRGAAAADSRGRRGDGRLDRAHAGGPPLRGARERDRSALRRHGRERRRRDAHLPRAGRAPARARARGGARLSLLSRGARDLPERQRSLRATLDWSVQLLDDDARRVLGALGAFSGGASLEALEAVAGDVDMVTALDDLLDAALVTRVRDAAEPRFGMLETVREYAADVLAASGDERAVRDRHLAWLLSMVEGEGLYWHRLMDAEWLDRVELEHDNIRAAFAHAE